MSEGGESCLQCNYLATMQSKKQWLVCGFNQFGQLCCETAKRNLLEFEEFKFLFREENPQILTSSWSYLAAANECSLQMRGFVSNRPKTVATFETENVIKALASCDRFCLILLCDGRLYKVLPQSGASLEEVKFQTNRKEVMQEKRTIFSDRISKTNTNLKIVFVACGNNIIAAIGHSNEIFGGITQIGQFPRHIKPKQLVCGFEHALLLTTNGDIYCWGNGLRGQLGQSTMQVEETPVILEALAGIKITHITASGWHSAAISSFGDLYTWGFNTNGQLGLKVYKNNDCTLKEPSVYPLPQVINLSDCRCSENKDDCNTYQNNCVPLKVVAGDRHTILIRNCGSVYASGWNAFGQLGLKNVNTFCDTFRYVLKIRTTNVDSIEVTCGGWSTFIGL